jgi:hypothetical protein
MENSFLIKTLVKNMTIILFSILINGCLQQTLSETLQNNALQLTPPPHEHFKQLSGNLSRPTTYFVCRDIINPCPPKTKIFKKLTGKRVNKIKHNNCH